METENDLFNKFCFRCAALRYQVYLTTIVVHIVAHHSAPYVALLGKVLIKVIAVSIGSKEACDLNEEPWAAVCAHHWCQMLPNLSKRVAWFFVWTKWCTFNPLLAKLVNKCFCGTEIANGKWFRGSLLSSHTFTFEIPSICWMNGKQNSVLQFHSKYLSQAGAPQ